jgi:trehalose 6-phosphate synthase/phosphatase
VAETTTTTNDDSGMDGPSRGTHKSSGQSSGTATPPTFSTANRLFFICFHLPVVVVQNQSTGQWRASWSESILAKSEGSQILSTYEAYWVGTVSTHPPLKTEADKDAVRAILEEMHCIPLFLDPDLVKSHYYGFCKQVLWPAFHNIDLLDMSTCGWLSDRESGARIGIKGGWITGGTRTKGSTRNS